MELFNIIRRLGKKSPLPEDLEKKARKSYELLGSPKFVPLPYNADSSPEAGEWCLVLDINKNPKLQAADLLEFLDQTFKRQKISIAFREIPAGETQGKPPMCEDSRIIIATGENVQHQIFNAGMAKECLNILKKAGFNIGKNNILDIAIHGAEPKSIEKPEDNSGLDLGTNWVKITGDEPDTTIPQKPRPGKL